MYELVLGLNSHKSNGSSTQSEPAKNLEPTVTFKSFKNTDELLAFLNKLSKKTKGENKQNNPIISETHYFTERMTSEELCQYLAKFAKQAADENMKKNKWF